MIGFCTGPWRAALKGFYVGGYFTRFVDNDRGSNSQVKILAFEFYACLDIPVIPSIHPSLTAVMNYWDICQCLRIQALHSLAR